MDCRNSKGSQCSKLYSCGQRLSRDSLDHFGDYEELEDKTGNEAFSMLEAHGQRRLELKSRNREMTRLGVSD